MLGSVLPVTSCGALGRHLGLNYPLPVNDLSSAPGIFLNSDPSQTAMGLHVSKAWGGVHLEREDRNVAELSQQIASAQ
jgi:hypothetical protein